MPNEGTAIVSARPAFEVDGQARAPLDAGLLRLNVRDGVDGLATCEAEFGNWGLNAQEQLGFLWFKRDVLEFGKRLVIKLGTDTLFDGVILAIEGRFPPNMPPTLVVRADDKLQALRMNRRTRHFEGVSDADVVRQVANDHGLQADVNLSGPTWPLLVQANESDLAFLRRRMLVADADLVVADGKLTAHPRPSRPRPAVCCSATSSVGSHWPLRARRISSVLVESMVGSTSTVKPGNSGDTASQMASAGQRMGEAALTGFGPLAWWLKARWGLWLFWRKTWLERVWMVATAPVVPSRAWAPAACPGSSCCRTSRGIRP